VVVHCGHLKPEGDDPEALYRGEQRNVDMMCSASTGSRWSWA
jgi:hypothetical protein